MFCQRKPIVTGLWVVNNNASTSLAFQTATRTLLAARSTHIINKQFYANLTKYQKPSQPLCCWRDEEPATLMLLWKPHHRQWQPRRPAKDTVTLLHHDTELTTSNAQQRAVENDEYRFGYAQLIMTVCPTDDATDDNNYLESCFLGLSERTLPTVH